MHNQTIMMTRNIFIVLIFLSFIPLIPISAQLSYIDSLIQRIDEVEGKQKLALLDQIGLIKKQEPGGVMYLKQYEKEAIKQKNDTAQTRVYMYYMHYYSLTTIKKDSTHYFMLKAKAIALDDVETKLSLQTMIMHVYLMEEKFGLAALFLQNEINDKQYDNNDKVKIYTLLNLSIVYHISKNYTIGSEACEEANKILNEMSDITAYEKTFLKSKIFMIHASLEAHNNNFDNSLSICDSLAHALDDIKYTYKRENYRIFSDALLHLRASAYTAKGEREKARQQLDSAKIKLNNFTNEVIIASYNNAEAEYYHKFGDNKKALEYINLVVEFYNDNYSRPDLIEANILKGKILNSLKMYDEAYSLLEKTYKLQDSLALNSVAAQFKELQNAHETEQMKVKMESKLRITQIVVMALFCIILLSIGIIIIIRKNNKRKEASNKKIYEQYLLMKSYLEEIKKQQEENRKLAERYDENSNIIKTETLADRIDEYLKTTEAFKNKTLSRTELALSLGTNRQYLTDAIREKTGKTFKDYLYEIRLEHAHRMLIESDSTTIEEVYTESGFSSRSTFNRLFRDQFGMSPNELRDITRETILEISRQEPEKNRR